MKKNVVKKSDNLTSKEYAKLLLEHIKTDILQTQLKAAMSITEELTLLYWRIGKTVSEKISTEGRGAKVAEKLAYDLRQSLSWHCGFFIKKFALYAKICRNILR